MNMRTYRKITVVEMGTFFEFVPIRYATTLNMSLYMLYIYLTK